MWFTDNILLQVLWYSFQEPYNASVLQADRQCCLQYISCNLLVVHTATENWKPQLVLVTEKRFGVLYIPYHSSLLGMWYWQGKLGTSTGNWPHSLTHCSAVDSPVKTPENLVPSAAHWLPSIPFFSEAWMWPCGSETDSSKAEQSQQGQSARGHHPGRDEDSRELEAQATAENWAQPRIAWSLFGWTNFHGLVILVVCFLQAGGVTLTCGSSPCQIQIFWISMAWAQQHSQWWIPICG